MGAETAGSGRSSIGGHQAEEARQRKLKEEQDETSVEPTSAIDLGNVWNSITGMFNLSEDEHGGTDKKYKEKEDDAHNEYPEEDDEPNEDDDEEYEEYYERPKKKQQRYKTKRNKKTSGNTKRRY